MPLVLAIEPDLRQAAIVKRIVREKVLADVAVVDSRDAALEAIRLAMPDVLLLSALLSPRDEDELIAHLRTLDNAGHLQTHTIPQLASALGPGEERASGGLLSAFRRKKKKDPAAPLSGCDPDIFAEEIRSYLQRAAELKRERLDGQAQANPRDHAWRAAQPQKGAASADPEPAPETESSGPSSWASPFEWKPSQNPSSLIAHPESPIAQPESPIVNPESPIAEPTLMAHLRPPKDVRVLEPLIVAAPVEELVQLAAPIDVTTPEPTPVMEPPPAQEVAPIKEEAPIQVATPIPDAGLRMKDSGLGIRDKRSGIRDSKFGALAPWARSEGQAPEAAEKTDDMYGLLMGLDVPPAVVAVGYGRGCRIRRVRVPAVPELMGTESAGPVILSKGMAEQREVSRGF